MTYTLLQLETSDKENDKEYRKELWCFWWGDEPPVLGTLTELEADPSSTWGEEAPNAQEGEKLASIISQDRFYSKERLVFLLLG